MDKPHFVFVVVVVGKNPTKTTNLTNTTSLFAQGERERGRENEGVELRPGRPGAREDVWEGGKEKGGHPQSRQKIQRQSIFVLSRPVPLLLRLRLTLPLGVVLDQDLALFLLLALDLALFLFLALLLALVVVLVAVLLLALAVVVAVVLALAVVLVLVLALPLVLPLLLPFPCRLSLPLPNYGKLTIFLQIQGKKMTVDSFLFLGHSRPNSGGIREEKMILSLLGISFSEQGVRREEKGGKQRE